MKTNQDTFDQAAEKVEAGVAKLVAKLAVIRELPTNSAEAQAALRALLKTTHEIVEGRRVPTLQAG